MKILDNITSPEDVKKLSQNELPILAEEIREKIIETAVKGGGHLASNLGIADATVALHRVFSCPEDSIIFDVGHQAYAHKLLTGRAADFHTLRQAGGISGFTNRGESKYDAVTAGHSGTSISTAVGIAEANRLAGRDNWAVAVIGDGSFTNGMVFEALEQLSGSDLKLVILLNDNEMSISKNVGGFSRYLSTIRTSERYYTFKIRLNKLLRSIPLIGEAVAVGAYRVKEFLKRLFGAETWFESLGLEYIGPLDGNDIAKTVSALEEAKIMNCPVIVHIKTKKGLGFAPAEEHPEKYHSTSAFVLEPEAAEKAEKKRTFTDELSDFLCEKGEADPALVGITAAMTDGCGFGKFSKKYPERFFDVGIAEEHAVTTAAGLAIGGKSEGLTPVLVLYSTFSQRVFDQLWHDVALQKDVHVVLMLSHAGIVPNDGVTHQGIYDVPLLTAIPGTTVYSPDDFDAFRKSVNEAYGGKGLTVVRYPKAGEAKYDVDFTDHGTWKVSGCGKTVVVTYGRVAENVAAAIRKAGIDCTLAVLRQIHPLPDDREFMTLINSSDRVLFIEESVRSGGIGEHLASADWVEKKVHVKAIDDPFIPHGDMEYLIRYAGLDEESIAGWIKE
ncbi:MAG: 1-deoxy-D-xylulose-5-phosphate synthase [Ruminococcaceae bacterium]|nr:1-deoxy-D-xylulose-5-phosphate synthase [Oscillospiraceae bacterium]